MAQEEAIKLFDEKQVRVVWDDVKEKYYFSVTDVIQVLTNSDRPRKYWSDLKRRLEEEGSELSAKIGQLKLQAADGKKYLTDVADTEQVFRLIQSIPSKKAEPFKLWLAHIGQERLNQMQDPELNIQQAIADYRRLGYTENWITQCIRSIETRKELTDEWKRGGMQEGVQFASLTDILTQAWSGLKTKEYKNLKGLRKESLRDNMTNVELALNTLAEASTTELSQQRNPKGFSANAAVAREGGQVAKVARQQLEASLGKSVIFNKRASDYLPPQNKSAIEEGQVIDDIDK